MGTVISTERFKKRFINRCIFQFVYFLDGCGLARCYFYACMQFPVLSFKIAVILARFAAQRNFN